MTKQVRKAYRSHRKRTLAASLLVAAIAAAVVIPIASGAPEKTYTLALNPSATCAGSTNGSATTILTLTNTAKSASLGSARITFPSGSIHSAEFSPARAGSIGVEGTDVITLSDLNLAKSSSLTIRVSFKAGAFAGSLDALVKQSNNFNDTQGTANLFDNPTTFPAITVATCAEIRGTVWNDRDEQGDVDPVADEPRLSNWTVRAWSGTNVVASTTTTASTGSFNYSLNVPANTTYVLCVTPNTGTWGQTKPTPPSAASCSATAFPQEPSGIQLQVASNATLISDQDFGNVATVAVACGGSASTAGYAVELGSGSNCTKGSAEYSFDSWTSGAQTYYKFVPFGTVDTTKTARLVEKLLASFAPDAGDTTPQTRLVFDDDLTDGVQAVEMPYCKSDPRSSDSDKTTLNATFNVVDVLPTGFTSCILETAQVLGGTPVKVNVTYYVFSAVDGYRAIPG